MSYDNRAIAEEEKPQNKPSQLERLQQRILHDPRIARVFHGSLTALIGRGLTVLVNVVTLPLTLRYLGKLEFGIWVTVSTSVVMLSVLDLGIANSLTNFIAEASAKDDRPKALSSFATAFWVTIAIVACLLPLLWLGWSHTDWATLFKLTDPEQITHARLCVAVAAGFFLCTLPLSLGNKVLAGYQQVHLANYFVMINSVLGFFAIVATIEMRGSIVTLMTAYCASLLVGSIALNAWIFLWHLPWITPRPRHVRPRMIRDLFGQGFLFFIIQSTGIVVFTSDNLVITHYLGAAQVTPYSFAWRLSNYAGMAQSVMLPSLWPAFTDAYHKQHLEWLRNTYRSVTRKTLTIVGIAAMLIGVFGKLLIRLWAGGAAVPGTELLWLMAAFNVTMAATTNQAFLLNATGRLRVEALVAVIAASANLSLSIYLVPRIGVDGAVLSTLLSFLVFMIVPQELEVRRVLSGRYLKGLGVTEVGRSH